MELDGLKLSFDELAALVSVTEMDGSAAPFGGSAGSPVMVNIEDRHFVVVMGVAGGLVYFRENGYSRTQTITEFKARWYGVALVKKGYNPDLLTPGKDRSMTVQELLKVKGGFF